MKVECEVTETVLYNDIGKAVDGIRAICSECGHETESFGTHDASVRRCLATMKDECPEEEDNFYVEA